MIDFVINEKAGEGKTLRAKKKICRILEERGIEYAFHSTSKSKHAIELTHNLCKDGATTIVAVGGDGTVNEVLNGIDTENVKMGIIPCGSGNDFVDSVGIPLDVEKALDLILYGESKPTDFMVCDGVRGINIIGTGIDVEILERCEKSKILKGKLKYFVSLIISLIKFRFYNYRLGSKDAEKKSAMILCCGNGRKFGGGIPMCPKAVTDDGKMDFIIISKMNKLKMIKYLIKLMQGKILDQPFCAFSLEDKVTAVFDEPITIEIDGELYENLKFDISLEKGKLKLFRP